MDPAEAGSATPGCGRGGRFDGVDEMREMDRMRRGEGMRFMVLIPLTDERFAPPLCGDLLFCGNIA